jgi:hypothetical protein
VWLGCAGGCEEALGARFAGLGGGWVEGGEVGDGLVDVGGLDLVEAVVGGDVSVLDEMVGAAEDADLREVEGEPLDGRLPGGGEDGHGEAGGTADVHGAGVDGDEEVTEGEDGGELGDGGAAGQRGSVGLGEGADAADGGGVGWGAEEDGLVAEGLRMGEDGGEAVVVPGGLLGAAALQDEGGEGFVGWVGFVEEGAGGSEV